jgi:hypothetical protein
MKIKFHITYVTSKTRTIFKINHCKVTYFYIEFFVPNYAYQRKRLRKSTTLRIN